ncbi:MAG: hypothetical protein AB2689_23365 [Candidatus Thiodiazotropha taylori]
MGGATVYDVAELEKILKRAIILKDIAGEDIYNSGKYQSRGADIELICHNGHAWPKDLHFPQSREVHIYEGDVWQAIREAIRGEPVAVWLLGGQDRQLSVDQFVLQDGRTKSAPNWATPNSLREPSAKTTLPASWQGKGTAGSRPRPTSSRTSRRPAWSTGTAASGTRWNTTRGTSSAST